MYEIRNDFMRRERFYVSYVYPIPEYEEDIESTALVLEIDVFFILRGDHRKGYSNVVDLKGALDYFLDHIIEAHSLSEHFYAAGKNANDELNIAEQCKEFMGVKLYKHFCEKLNSRFN